ncbi:hypothetical protein HZH66_002143 [Vespula vulgaris]|uniref:Uncharacterized protein n=1 Tax=Vespula vulgaris TaxID=7454 RepID=A0A834KKL2_VESVU|nr:hypothetical protein HZH66_002143 [Vespula vulgaris]
MADISYMQKEDLEDSDKGKVLIALQGCRGSMDSREMEMFDVNAPFIFASSSTRRTSENRQPFVGSLSML